MDGSIPTAEEARERAAAHVDPFREAVLEVAADLEFETFLLGSTRPDFAAGLDREDSVLAAWKRELHMTVGLQLEERWESLGRTVAFDRPEVIFKLDPLSGRVTRQIAPVFVYGRYRKLDRTVPQTHWDCRPCRGTGRELPPKRRGRRHPPRSRTPTPPPDAPICPDCGGTGRRYPDSVEELLAAVIVPALDGTAGTLHGMGREDIDALMLGDGRPFVLEVTDPCRRSIDADAAIAALDAGPAAGRVQLARGPWIGSHRTLRVVKHSSPSKSYLARARVERELRVEDVAAVEALEGQTIEQQTPKRVVHRRADLVRPRVLERVRARLDPDDAGRLELEVRAQSGTYIKEMISGDGGRTTPSVAELLGAPAICEELDVVAIHFDEGGGVPGVDGADARGAARGAG